MNQNDTSNIFLSCPAGSDSALRYQFSCQFKPPPNVAGKRCHLQVYFVGVQVSDAATVTDATVLNKRSTYAITINFPQPHSCGTINDATNVNALSVATPDPTGWVKGVLTVPANKCVAPFFTNHNQGVVGFVTTDINGVLCQDTKFPSVLVTIPFHQEIVTVQLIKLNGTDKTLDPTTLQQLSVGFMLTPI